MSVYSNSEIKKAVKSGHIIVHPFTEKHVNGSSIDVTLGEWYYRTDRRTGTHIYNPLDKEDVVGYFGEPQKAIIHEEWCRIASVVPFKNIQLNHPIIVLEPGERILAHTNEFIGIKAPGTTSMHSRSTWGRNGLAVCFDAGWGDPGYINRWTLEIYNLNQRHSIVLPVGERIAQIVFHHTGRVDGEYYNLSGKYQTGSEKALEDLIKKWEPSLMLPKAYKDKRFKLIK